VTLQSKLTGLRVSLLKFIADVPFYAGVIILVSDGARYDPHFLTDAPLVGVLLLTTVGLQEVVRREIRRGRA
jgi:hypothetical protein